MIIAETDYERIGTYMLHLRWMGSEFVACPFWNGPVTKEEIFEFNNADAAREFCDEYSTDMDRYGYLSTRSIYRCMSEALHDKSLMVEKGGLVDILSMINKYHNKLEGINVNKSNDLKKLEQKEETMNQKNFEYLTKQMFYAGLGEVPVTDLQNKLKEGKDDFQLIHQKKFGNDNVTARLNFKKSDQDASMYFFNSFDVLFKKQGEQETMQQNFRISYGNDFRFDEAYKLMNGRSIDKTFVMTDKQDRDIRQEINAMVYMDFKNADKYGNFEIVKVYGYDLEKKLEGYPIKDFESESTKNKIITDLKKGEVAAVTMNTKNGDMEMRMTVNAKFDSLDLYDAKMKPLSKSAINKIQNGETVSQGESKSQNNKNDTAKSQSKKPDENKPGEGDSKIIKKPDHGQDKSPSLRVG